MRISQRGDRLVKFTCFTAALGEDGRKPRKKEGQLPQPAFLQPQQPFNLFFIVSLAVQLSVVWLSVSDCCGLRWVGLKGRVMRYVSVYCCCVDGMVWEWLPGGGGQRDYVTFPLLLFWPHDQTLQRRILS